LRRHHGSLGESDIRQAVDEAVVWHVFGDASEERVFDELKRDALKSRAQVRLEIKFDDATVRALLVQTALFDNAHFARALARALPWYNWKCRQLVSIRERTYASLWYSYLKDGGWTFDYAAKAAGEWLKNDPLGKEIYLSERYDHTGLVTFAENVEAFDRTASRWASFANGINAWHDAVAQRRSPNVLSEVFDRLQVLWT